jgi:RecT family
MRAAKRRVVRKAHKPIHRVKTQALTVARPAPKPWLLSPDEVTILKNAVCKGATDEELKYCLAVAARYELDPFQQQIWFVPRWDSEAQRSDGEKGAIVRVPVVGINGLLHLAARDHADFGTFSRPEYGPLITVEWYDKHDKKKKTFQAPEWASVKAWKKGCAEPTVGEVWWNEIYPDVDRAPLVRRMPRLMLAKCATAQATRKAYPKTGGLLVPEETHTREFTDITPSGRIIQDRQEKYLDNFEKREQEQLAKIKQVPQSSGEGGESDKIKAGDLITDSPCLFYIYHAASHTSEITGSQDVLKAHRELLKPLWDANAKAIVANDEQLESLKYQFEQRGVIFRELKENK